MSQALDYPLIRDVAAIEQSPIDKYGDFVPSADVIRATTYLTHKSVDRVFANDPVGKVDPPEYMANWMYVKIAEFRFEADALWFLHNNPDYKTNPVVAPVTPELQPPEQVVVPEPAAPVETGAVTQEVIDAAWEMSPEEYVATHNNGELITVQLRGSDPATVPADIQQIVDIVWRLENGRSYETVKEALTVSLAESGWDNTAVNWSDTNPFLASDQCLFQINRINKELVESMGYTLDQLRTNPEACVRVAFALFELSEGFKYSASYIDKWEKNYGLKLPVDLLDLVNSGYISNGWQWWLMSAKRTGLL